MDKVTMRIRRWKDWKRNPWMEGLLAKTAILRSTGTRGRTPAKMLKSPRRLVLHPSMSGRMSTTWMRKTRAISPRSSDRRN
jgi:hypothetical protein